MAEKHQITLVSTNSCDSGVSGLSQTMAIAITPTRNVSLDSNEDDASRMDCCDTTASSVSMSDHESTNTSSEEGEEVVHDASISQTSSSCRRRLFQKQSSWNSAKESSKESSKQSSKESSKESSKDSKDSSSKPKKNFRLRPQFKLPSKNDDVPSITDSSTSTEKEAKEAAESTSKSNNSNSNSNSNANSEPLFQDQMDIVAFQEWPPQRRQPNQRRYRHYHNHHSHNFHQYPLHVSPSTVCASFSVETIATKLGRSPVVVSFDDVDLVHPPAPLAPIALAGRIPTGRFPPHSNQSSFEEDSCRSASRPTSCSDLMADSIFKTIRSMMCTNNNSNSNSNNNSNNNNNMPS